MHPLTHPLPVTAHVSLLDKNSLRPEPPTLGWKVKTDAKSVFYVLIQTPFQINTQLLIHTHYLPLHLYIR